MIPFELVSANSILLQNRRYGLFFYCFNFILQCAKRCFFTYEQRKQILEAIRYVDLVIPETCWEQKFQDVKEYHIDTFVMGDDWKGKFDFLKDKCEVIYLPRTPEISTTKIKTDLNGKDT